MVNYVFFITITLSESKIRERPGIMDLEKSFSQNWICSKQVMWAPGLVIRTLAFTFSFWHIPGFQKHWRGDSKIPSGSGKKTQPISFGSTGFLILLFLIY